MGTPVRHVAIMAVEHRALARPLRPHPREVRGVRRRDLDRRGRPAMAAGQLKEFDSPITLLQNPASFFTKLVGLVGCTRKKLRDRDFAQHCTATLATAPQRLGPGPGRV